MMQKFVLLFILLNVAAIRKRCNSHRDWLFSNIPSGVSTDGNKNKKPSSKSCTICLCSLAADCGRGMGQPVLFHFFTCSLFKTKHRGAGRERERGVEAFCAGITACEENKSKTLDMIKQHWIESICKLEWTWWWFEWPTAFETTISSLSHRKEMVELSLMVYTERKESFTLGFRPWVANFSLGWY